MDSKHLLQKARQDWIAKEIQSLGIEFPVAEISKKMGKHTGFVSMYLSNKRAMSVSFMKAFCEAYGIDFDAVNHAVIEQVKKELADPQQTDTKNNNSSKQIHIDGVVNNEDEILSLSPTKNIPVMLDRMITLLERKEKNMEDLISNNGKFADGLLELIHKFGTEKTDTGQLGKLKAK